MQDRLNEIEKAALAALDQVDDPAALEAWRVTHLGRSSDLMEVFSGLGKLSKEERPVIGAAANRVKVALESALESRAGAVKEAALAKSLEEDELDVTLPGRNKHIGRLHPSTQQLRRVLSILAEMGFQVFTSREVETDEFNFQHLNFPPHHPARDMQDTFFVGPGLVLRTHTTPVQMRTMRSRQWPIRILCPGAVYRCDDDATHSPMFHQIEGLWVDRGIRMSDLKGTLDFFAKELFGPEARVRMRPSYFPFVEPGAEVDVYHKKLGWLEIMGAGMVHPHLFRTAGYGAGDGISGFAFGMGIERIAMILHGISDLRMMYAGDTRFLRQFS